MRHTDTPVDLVFVPRDNPRDIIGSGTTYVASTLMLEILQTQETMTFATFGAVLFEVDASLQPEEN